MSNPLGALSYECCLAFTNFEEGSQFRRLSGCHDLCQAKVRPGRGRETKLGEGTPTALLGVAH